jgi:hypothetical protein
MLGGDCELQSAAVNWKPLQRPGLDPSDPGRLNMGYKQTGFALRVFCQLDKTPCIAISEAKISVECRYRIRWIAMLDNRTLASKGDYLTLDPDGK